MDTDIKPPLRSKQSIADWLIAWIAKELSMAPGDIDTRHSLLQYSLSSVTATILVGDLEDWLDLRLSPTMVWDYPSIDAMADFLSETAAATHAAAGSPVAGALPATNARELLDGLDDLSDADVDALLNQLVATERPA